MKKLIIVLLIMTMGLSVFMGCGGSDKNTEKGPNKGTESSENKDTGKEDAVGKDDTAGKKDEIDTSIYTEKVELRSDSEKKVVAYYDPTVVECIKGENLNGTPAVDLGLMSNVYVAHTETAEDFINYIISKMGGEIGKHEESSLSSYTVHYFTLVEPGKGTLWDKIYVLELDSDVVLNFRLLGSMEKGSQLEKELGAIKFVVEE